MDCLPVSSVPRFVGVILGEGLTPSSEDSDTAFSSCSSGGHDQTVAARGARSSGNATDIALIVFPTCAYRVFSLPWLIFLSFPSAGYWARSEAECPELRSHHSSLSTPVPITRSCIYGFPLILTSRVICTHLCFRSRHRLLTYRNFVPYIY
jgi:hypothetical protein